MQRGCFNAGNAIIDVHGFILPPELVLYLKVNRLLKFLTAASLTLPHAVMIVRLNSCLAKNNKQYCPKNQIFLLNKITYKCNKCDKRFSRINYLTRYEQKHENQTI